MAADGTPAPTPGDGYTRRTFLAGAAGTAAALALPGCAGETPAGPAGGAGRLAALATGASAAPEGRVVGQLGAMSNELRQIGARLSSLRDEIDRRPGINPPNIRVDEAVRGVRGAAERIVVTADDMLTRVESPAPE